MAKRLGLFVVGFALMLVPISGSTQEKEAKGDKVDGKKIRDGFVGRVLHLMPPAFAVELKLTAEQNGQIQKLEQEFKDLRTKSMMGTVSRIIAIVESMDEGDDKEVAPVLALAHEITGGLLESRRLRINCEKKLAGVLNAEQQTKFAELKERRPRLRGETTFHFYPPEGQERLRLTDDQKQKLRALQMELETKLRDFLTEEQRKLFDQLHPQRKDAKDPPSKD
jgi:Spy/CpxP family protein refolding chaperone